jgi:hypothetical protein
MSAVDQNPTNKGPNPELEPAQNASQIDSNLFTDLTNKFVDDEKAKYKNFNLKYPSTIDSGQDRIVISQLQYIPSLNITNSTDSSNSTFRGESQFRKEKFIGSVVLPMPNDISESNSVGWGEDSLGNFAAMVMPGLVQAGVGIAGVDFGKSGAGMAKVTDAFKSGALGNRVEQYFAANAAASLLKKINVNVNPEAYITRATGVYVNPNMELLFNGPKLRQFGLAFKMTPRSRKEAKSVRAIIQFFKKGMSPRRSSNQEFSFFLGTPNVFQVQFKSGNNELRSIGKFKTCALVSFSVNYTPDGFYAAFEDSLAGGSQPISVTMQMAFSELTPVYSDEYDLDDENVNIGPSLFSNEYDSRVESGQAQSSS